MPEEKRKGFWDGTFESQMDEQPPAAKAKETTEEAFRWCINEDSYQGKNVLRVELAGIARFACWWFVILSMVGLVAGILDVATRY